MNDKNITYRQEKKSSLSTVLWTLAMVAVIVVIGLYIYGKTIHDSLALS